jgi:hypothetical protein
MWSAESPQHVAAFDEEDMGQNNWIARARVLVHELPQLYLRDFDFDELIRVLRENDNLNLLHESIERVNRENGQFPFFDFEDRQITINGERQSIDDLFEMHAEAGNYLNAIQGYNEIDGDIISTLEEIVGLFPELNPISREYWISRARTLVDELPELGLNGFDFDSLIGFLQGEGTLELLDNSIDRIINQQPEYNFEDRSINVNGEDTLLNDYFEGLNTSFDADIIDTLYFLLRTYPQRDPRYLIWIERGRELVHEFPELGLENFDFDNLINELERDNGVENSYLDFSADRVNRLWGNVPEYDFGDRQIHGQLMNQLFDDRQEDGDILNTIIEFAEEYPQLNIQVKKQKRGGRKSKRSYNKINKRKQTKKINKKSNKKSNKKFKKINKKTRKTRK